MLHDITKRFLLDTSPVEWDEKISELSFEDREEIALDLADLMTHAAMLRGYIEGRFLYERRDHEAGVKSANAQAAKVRTLLGYAYPKSDVRF